MATNYDERFVSFAQQRGFDPDWLADMGITIADEDEVAYSGRWIRIPYTHKNGLWYNRYRVIPGTGAEHPKYLSPPGASPRLFNPLHLGPDADYVWFTEGEFDALTLINIGVNAVAVGGAKTWKPHWSALYGSAIVLVGYDADEAGRKNAVKTVNVFTNAFDFDKYPKSINDFNEWMLEDKENLMDTVYGFMGTVGAG